MAFKNLSSKVKTISTNQSTYKMKNDFSKNMKSKKILQSIDKMIPQNKGMSFIESENILSRQSL